MYENCLKNILKKLYCYQVNYALKKKKDMVLH